MLRCVTHLYVRIVVRQLLTGKQLKDEECDATIDAISILSRVHTFNLIFATVIIKHATKQVYRPHYFKTCNACC